MENKDSIIACEDLLFQDAKGPPRTVICLLKLKNLRLDKNLNPRCGNLDLLVQDSAHRTVPVGLGRNAICYYFH